MCRRSAFRGGSPSSFPVVFCFEVADPGQDTCYWKAYNLRQTIVATYGGCKRSAKQMAHDIFLYKKLKEAETGTTSTGSKWPSCTSRRGRRPGTLSQ
jgi:hypothetical protein